MAASQLHRSGSWDARGPRQQSNQVSRFIDVPEGCMGSVVGKGGSVLNELNRIPGVLSVSAKGRNKILVKAQTQHAYQAVAERIRCITTLTLSKKKGVYIPEFSVTCFKIDDGTSNIWIEQMPHGMVQIWQSRNITPSYQTPLFGYRCTGPAADPGGSSQVGSSYLGFCSSFVVGFCGG